MEGNANSFLCHNCPKFSSNISQLGYLFVPFRTYLCGFYRPEECRSKHFLPRSEISFKAVNSFVFTILCKMEMSNVVINVLRVCTAWLFKKNMYSVFDVKKHVQY